MSAPIEPSLSPARDDDGMSKRTAVLSCATPLAALLTMGCPEAHDRRVYPIIDVAVDEATCAREGVALGSGGPFARRFGPYTPPDASRWLGGSVAWSRDGATLVASQDSRFETRSVGERTPSSEGLVVFTAARSCARAVAFLDAPTDELGASLAISPSGGFIAATGYVPRPIADGFEHTAPAAHVFTREGASFVSRAPIPSSGFARVAFVGERLGLLHSVAAPSQLAVFTLGATASITDLIRSEDEETGVNVAASSSGEYAAIVSLEGLVTLARFDGDSSTFTTVHEPGVYDGLPPTVSVADTGRVRPGLSARSLSLPMEGSRWARCAVKRAGPSSSWIDSKLTAVINDCGHK